MSIRWLPTSTIIVPMLGLGSGCAPEADRAAALRGSEWVLQEISSSDGTVRPDPEHPVTVSFTNETVDEQGALQRLHGSAGCNQFFGGYQLDGGGGISVSDLGATRMMCADPIMVVEDALLQRLPSASVFLISGSDLVMEFDGGKLRFVAGGSTP